MSGKRVDVTGQRFGRLVIVEFSHTDGPGRTYWICRCDCGKIKTILGASMNAGATQSCGCLAKERTSQACTSHGQTNTRLYRVWRNMKSRCNCPSSNKYYNYGGKGVSVCEEWTPFEGFQKWALSHGYAADLTIDRFDGSGNYEPSNCHWATYKEQSNNTTQNHILEFNGMRKNLKQWSEFLGISYKALSERARRGWSANRALTTPVMTRINPTAHGKDGRFVGASGLSAPVDF